MGINEINNQSALHITLIDFIICLAGFAILGYWLLKTSWGKKALVDSPPRRNNMPVYLPFILLLIWTCSISAAILIAEKGLPAISDWQRAFVENLIIFTGTTAGIILILYLAGLFFTNRLKGFGLSLKKIHRDFGAAALNLLSIWPIILLALVITVYFGEHIYGPDFQIRQHEELKLITMYPQLELRVLIVVTATIVVPIFEEMLFRGLFQTAIRTYLARFGFFQRLKNSPLRPWAAILITSVLFAAAHQEPAHWPALLVLGLCLGYSYEKSGSLLRPIFIHLLFNTLAIGTALFNG